MNRRAKGRKHELAVAKLLEKQGFLVEVSKPVARWINGRIVSAVSDFFGIADIIAIDKKTGKTWLIQVTADTHTSRKLEALKQSDIPDKCKILVQIKKRKNRKLFVFKNINGKVFMVLNSKGENVSY